jgi:hypothetical protein
MVIDKVVNEHGHMPVKVFYCKCGKSVHKVSTYPHAETNRATRKEFRDAEKWGRKVETITLDEFMEKPFLCAGVHDCPNFGNMVTLTKLMKQL